MSYDLSSKCRTCLSESNAYHHLYDYVEENYKILEMLDSIVPQIDIKTSSQFSTLVCKVCADKLLTSYKFQQLCIDTNSRLHDLIGIETEPKLEKLLNPLIGDSNFKLKHEVEEEFVSETPLNELSEIKISHLNGDTDSSSFTTLIVKEEIELTPQILDDNEDSFNNKFEETDDISEYELFTKSGVKDNKIIDFVDTGIGEVEHNKKKKLFQHQSETEGNFHWQSPPEGFNSPDRPRRFEKQASLSSHRHTHTRNTSEANYLCIVCQRNYSSIRNLTNHITNKHPDFEKHKCDQCGITFVIHAHLVNHLNRHKGNRKLVCSICEKEFRYNYTLNKHMRDTHSGESSFLCPLCGKKLNGGTNLREHMERHTGLKKYQCPECPTRFNCKSDVIKHVSTHSNAKPHVCDICGSRFTRAYSLRKHKLIHSGERPFKCDQCNMTFAIIDILRRHMRTHTGEKPYKCKYCERAYSASGDLTKHLRTHVGKNTYMCDKCPMAFKYQAELKKHQSQHYKMEQLLQQTENFSEGAQQKNIEQTKYATATTISNPRPAA